MARRDDKKLIKKWESSRFKEQFPDVSYEEFINSFPAKNKKDEVKRDKVKKELKKPSDKWNEQQLQKNIEESKDPVKRVEEYQKTQEALDPLIRQDKEEDRTNRERYREDAREDVTTDLPGLTPNQRRSMQQGANAQINKQVQNYKRMISSASGRRGIRGGAAAAPQMELARQGLDAQNQFQRDLSEKDIDLQMRRMAAYLASVEGRSAEDLLRRGMYMDYIKGDQQKLKEAAYAKYRDNYLKGVGK